MVVLVSLIVLLKGFTCFHDFFAWCISSIHPHSFNGMIFALVPHIFYGSRICIHSDAHEYMRICVALCACLDHMLVQ